MNFEIKISFFLRKMKLSLTNFRCHKNKQLKLPSNGLLLLNGKNGQGKSTIFESIYFALYGDVKKPYTFGSSSCKVELTFTLPSSKQIKIIRTKPQRVIVEFENETYEDKIAQSIINKEFMNQYEFLASSYIKQIQTHSILRMTPAEQLSFIKNLAFSSSKPEDIKQCIKGLIMDNTLDLSKTKGSLETLTRQLKDYDERDDFTIREPPSEQIDETIEINSKKLQEQKRLKKKMLLEAEEEQEEMKDSIMKKEILKKEIQNIKNEIDNFKITDIDLLEKEITKLENTLNDYLKFKLYEETLLQKEEDEERLNELKLMIDKEDLLNQQYEEYLYYVSKNKEQEKLLKKFNMNHSDLLNYLKQHTMDYQCPSCNTTLIINDDKLEVIKKNINEKDHHDYSNEIRIMSEKLKKIENPKSELDELIFLKREFEKLKNKKYVNFENIPQEISLSFQELQELSISEFENLIDEKNEQLEFALKNKTQFNILTKKIERKEKELKELEYDVHINFDIKGIKNEYEKISKDYEKSLEAINKNKDIQYQHQRYQQYLMHKEATEKLKLKIVEIKKENEKLEQRQKELFSVREKSAQAEVLALDKTVDTINTIAKNYLDQFFKDPITVMIDNYKQGKNDLQCKMNTIIEYRGEEYSSIDQLSGGERQKCELAFELAINEFMKSNILMLDECINNLDNEVNTEIIELLRDNAQNKLIMMISHECVNGLFDKVVTF